MTKRDTADDLIGDLRHALVEMLEELRAQMLKDGWTSNEIEYQPCVVAARKALSRTDKYEHARVCEDD